MTTLGNNSYVYDPMTWYKASGRRIVFEEVPWEVDDTTKGWRGKGFPIADGKTMVAMTLPIEERGSCVWTPIDGELLISGEVIRNPDYALAFRNPNYEWRFRSLSAFLALIVTINTVKRYSYTYRSFGLEDLWGHWEGAYYRLSERFKKGGYRFKRNNFSSYSLRHAEGLCDDLRAVTDCINSPEVPEFFRAGTTYREYLNSPHWHLVRAAAIHKADYRCQLCHSPNNLQVHHRTYERRGEEKLSDVTVLCRDCHRKFHGIASS